ncbi:MAG: MarR family transcriptional regulator [Bacteroidota bacterium]|nr:MarR family transcriptional regulator [Bacteroidota bacterium]
MEYTEILINIRKILRSLNLESKKIQKEYGVSIPQLMCLDYLGSMKDFRSTQGNIARYLNLNSSTMSGIVDRLESKGFVARLPNPEDRRTVFISLTSNGAKLLEVSPQLLHKRLSKKLEKLPTHQINKINNALKILVEGFEIEEISASPIITIEDPIVIKPDKS